MGRFHDNRFPGEGETYRAARDELLDAEMALRRQVAAHEDFPLMALLSASQAAGSLIIGLALVKGRLTALDAFEAALLDETYQMERWGADTEALARHEALRGDLEQAARLLALLKS